MKVPVDFGFYGILSEPRVGYRRLAELMVERIADLFAWIGEEAQDEEE